ncbi:hypothetical protein LEN26_010140 [Aphanomyces euteiches]|nr:hypothetical protein LEN26_010140 [Aphanomyces euteiches]KAH9129807.1 hypothetical protein AeMF1_000155 [Aphanomyces euteiches]KAH9196418.1 hypothetical protein AeNC1_001604 [Aphanomyces euteiches]
MEFTVVRDAETGEWIEVPLPKAAMDHEAQPQCLPLISTYEKVGMFTPYSVGKQGVTQSTRKLGTSVEWEKQAEKRRLKWEKRRQESVCHLRRQLEDSSLSPDEKRRIQIQLLEKMKSEYKHQLETVIQEELEREQGRSFAIEHEKSDVTRKRLQHQYNVERELYRTQIERIKEECNLSLTATMEKFNLLR